MNILFKQVIFKFHASFRGVIIHKPELVGHVFFGKCLSLLKIVVPMVYFFGSLYQWYTYLQTFAVQWVC